MQHLEGSGTPVLYIGRTVLKGYMTNLLLANINFRIFNINALCHSCAKIACFSFEMIFTVFFFMWEAESRIRASNSSRASTFVLHTSPFV